ncbi:MAG: hypothetical protein LBU58_02450 [Clostridiales bacterium]|jgi:beta-mannosidase|nr:hypothetical protein [Clostridiales bacterium]
MSNVCVRLSGFRLAQVKSIPPDGKAPSLAGLDWIPAQPGRAVQYELIDAGLLENPYASHEAAVKAQYVPQADWVYHTEFDLPPDFLSHNERFFIELDCVDTFADIFVNGRFIGACNNMLIPWRFELFGLLERKNSLVVHVKGHSRMVSDKADEAQEKLGGGVGSTYVRERSLVRRYQRSYAEDFAFVGQGFWGIGLVRPVNIVGTPKAYLRDVEFFTRSVGLPEKERAETTVIATVDLPQGADADADAALPGAAGYSVKATLAGADGAVVAEGRSQLAAAAKEPFGPSAALAASVELTVKAPRLWWPNGYGEQYLYTLTVTLADVSGREIHSLSREVGIKEIELVRKTPSGRFDFRFVVNGKPIYVKGGNLIPIDVLNAGGTPEQTETLLRLAVNAGINMVRLWGGGMHEPDWYYSLLDRYGILLWMDGHLHSHAYPDYDEAFNEEVRKETVVMVRQLRSHPCFAVFCGGNEQQEGWEAWGWKMSQDRFYGERLIYDILPKVQEEFCPEIPYVSNSPHGEKLSQSPVDGETHTWGNFYNATEDPLFITETCWYVGTISRPETLERWMGIKVDDYQGKNWNRRWLERTTTTLWQVNQFSEYHMNSGLREYARGLELEQMTADYMSLYYIRTRGPSCTGIIYWPFNKGGPMMNYGCVDYSQYPLMPYYLCVRLFKRVLIHAYRDSSDIRVRVTNDGEAFSAKLTLRLFDSFTGETLKKAETDVDVPYGAAHAICTESDWYDGLTNRWRQAVHAALTDARGELISEDFLLFCPLFEVETQAPKLTVEPVKVSETEWDLTIQSDRFIKHLELECNARVMFSDNYFKLMPETTRKLRLTVLGDRKEKLTLTARALDHESAARTLTL